LGIIFFFLFMSRSRLLDECLSSLSFWFEMNPPPGELVLRPCWRSLPPRFGVALRKTFSARLFFPLISLLFFISSDVPFLGSPPPVPAGLSGGFPGSFHPGSSSSVYFKFFSPIFFFFAFSFLPHTHLNSPAPPL